MHKAQKLAQALRRLACENYPSACRTCGARGHCGSQIEHKAADELEAMLTVHQLDQAEIVKLRRQIEAMETEARSHE